MIRADLHTGFESSESEVVESFETFTEPGAETKLPPVFSTIEPESPTNEPDQSLFTTIKPEPMEESKPTVASTLIPEPVNETYYLPLTTVNPPPQTVDETKSTILATTPQPEPFDGTKPDYILTMTTKKPDHVDEPISSTVQPDSSIETELYSSESETDSQTIVTTTTEKPRLSTLRKFCCSI